MNEIEKLRNAYNNPHNSYEKQRTEEKINNHIKLIESQVASMKSTIDNTTRNIEQLWEQRTALYNILHKQEKVIHDTEKIITTPHQVNMLKQPQYPKITNKNISLHDDHLGDPENLATCEAKSCPISSIASIVIPNVQHTFLIVKLDLPHKWLYDYKITQLSKHIKNNQCVVKIDMDSIPQQHKQITEVSGVKNGYIDIYVNSGVNKIYNICITYDYANLGLDIQNIILSHNQTTDQSQVFLVGTMCGIRTCFCNT